MAQLRADHPDKNKHHTESHVYRSEQEFNDEMFGRGAGDADVYGYPGEPVEPNAGVIIPKGTDAVIIQDITI